MKAANAVMKTITIDQACQSENAERNERQGHVS